MPPRVIELAAGGFEGPVYKVFENELCAEAWPTLRGMLREEGSRGSP